MKTAHTVLALKVLSLLLFLVGVTALGISSAHADGGVFYNGSHNWGVVVGAPGNAVFNFGNGSAPASFQGSTFTSNGNSSFNGSVGFSAAAFVPNGTFGSAQAGGFMSHYIESNHFGGASNVNQTFSGGTNSSSTGSGSSNSFMNFNQGGSSSWTAPTFVFGGKG